MTKQVIYSDSTGAILQWQDTDKLHYSEVPDGIGVLEVTEAVWEDKETYLSVNNGEISESAPLPDPLPPEVD